MSTKEPPARRRAPVPSVAKEAGFRSHQALVRRGSPREARRSRTRGFHRHCGEPVEP
jgi:hypothetical protein